MMIRRERWIFVLIVSMMSTTVVLGDEFPVCRRSSLENDDDEECQLAHTSVSCGVYMAPSTVGIANMGIYTSQDMVLGEVVNYPEIAIPLLFRDWGDHGAVLDGVLWDRYIWDHGVANTEPKVSDLQRMDNGAVFVPGVGCTVNSRLELSNIKSTHGSTYSTEGLHRSRQEDVGVGAFCPYHGSQTTVTRDIVAGSELFAAYGDTWIPDIPGVIVTMDETMEQADDFLSDYYEATTKLQLEDEELEEALWNLTRSFGNGGTILKHNFVLGAIPRDASWKQVKDHLEKAKEASSELQRDQQIAQKATLSTSRNFVDQVGIRSLKWLQQHGKCQDHLQPKRSTLPQAGKGAFATRFLPKGTVVGFSPLIHFGTRGREVLKLNDVYQDDTHERDDLILNYSFGHSKSTILLTPYGAMVNYINHSREHANVKLQFPATELIAHKPEWLLKSPSDYLTHVHEKIGLSFDYIALRDISEEEEVFLDYGDEWIAAWETHLRNWKPITEKDYVHRTEWTEPHLRTLTEEKYPDNLITLCTVSYQRQEEGVNLWIPLLRTTNERKYCDVIERYTQPGEESSYLYTVRIHMNNHDDSNDDDDETNNDDDETNDDDQEESILIVRDVPSPTGVELVDKLHSADFHLPQAFRHYIQIPDDILPDAWKNKE